MGSDISQPASEGQETAWQDTENLGLEVTQAGVQTLIPRTVKKKN